MRLVIIPLMPEGVEHRRKADGTVEYFSVIIPLMPEGVEHTPEGKVKKAFRETGDHSSDAGRR